MDKVLGLGTLSWYSDLVLVLGMVLGPSTSDLDWCICHSLCHTLCICLFQGETWHKFRQAVQKDMMCPSGTLRYIKDIEDIALDLTEVRAEKMKADDGRTLFVDPKSSLFIRIRESIIKNQTNQKY